MKKVMRFIKRRICPIMLALVIVFFSVVIPCAKVEAASVAVPVDGFTYFDLVYTLFYTTGFEASIMKEDGTRKTFTEEMYDELCDCFDIWCYQNFGTTDADEIKGQLRALPDQIVDGTVTVSKALWEAVQSWASDVYDTISNYINPDDFVTDDGYYTGAFANALLGFNYFDPDALGNKYFLYGTGYITIGSTNYDIKFFKFTSDSRCKYSGTGFYAYNSYWGTYDDPISPLLFRLSDNYQFTSSSGSYCIYNAKILSTNMNIVDSSNESIPAPTAPDVLWPQQDLAIDKVGSTTWDDAIASDVVVPGEVADTGSIAIDDSIPADSDVIPGTVDVPEEKDDTKEEEKEKEEEEDPADDAVTSEEIAGIADSAAAAGDITKLFPFCIPFDLVALIKGMKAQEKAPVWHFKYYFKDINYTFEFTVDMTDYEKYIKIFRAGIVIFWIIALMFITIRYSSGIAKD